MGLEEADPSRRGRPGCKTYGWPWARKSVKSGKGPEDLLVEGKVLGKEAVWRMTFPSPQQSEVMRLDDPAETLRI